MLRPFVLAGKDHSSILRASDTVTHQMSKERNEEWHSLDYLNHAILDLQEKVSRANGIFLGNQAFFSKDALGQLVIALNRDRLFFILHISF